VAATYPQEIVDAAQWVHQNRGMSGSALQEAARSYDWDPSIQALLAFPDVLDRMSENIQWTTDLGNAFLSDEGAVMDAVQRLRNQAYASGTLSSNGQAVVTTAVQGPSTVVAIQPASPEVIYVPVYDPFYVWGPVAYPYPALRYDYAPAYVRYGRVGFLPGIHINSWYSGWNGWSGWGWSPNWSRRVVVVNNNFYDRYGYHYRERDRYPNRVVGNRSVYRAPVTRTPVVHSPVVRQPVVREPVVRQPVSRPSEVHPPVSHPTRTVDRPSEPAGRGYVPPVRQPNVDRSPNVSRSPSDYRPNRPAPSTPVVHAPSNPSPAPRVAEQKHVEHREPQGRNQGQEHGQGKSQGNEKRSSGNNPKDRSPHQ